MIHVTPYRSENLRYHKSHCYIYMEISSLLEGRDLETAMAPREGSYVANRVTKS